MIDTIVSISRSDFGEVFVQTNIITKSDKIQPMSDCQLDMSEEDCIDLAMTLSHILTYTEYEDEEYNVTRFSDGKVIKEYKNE